MKKSFSILLMFILVVALVAGCAQPAPALAPAPAPAPSTAAPKPAPSAAPTTAAAPKPTPATSPATAQKHEQVRIEIMGAQLGFSAYVLTFALAELINKHSQWLRADARETAGSEYNARFVAENPDKRKSTVFVVSSTTFALGKQGKDPFKAPYLSGRILARWADYVAGLVTLNSKIQTKDDLIGKRFGLSTVGSASRFVQDVVYGPDGWNILDKIKISTGSADKGADNLLDGLIDVWGIGFTGKGDNVANSPASSKLLAAQRDRYWISIPAQVIESAAKATALPVVPFTLKAGSLEPKQGAFTLFVYSSMWAADAALPDDVAYEVSRIIYEFRDEFKLYDAAGEDILAENLTKVPFAQNDWHPGAVKLYGEKGIKLAQ